MPATDDRHLADLRSALRGHQTADPREALALNTMLAELSELDDPFDRHASLTHVTASAIVVGTRGVLLHRHRRLHRWLQPGGHLEPGERPGDAALRESEEETGLRLAHPSSGPVLVHVDVHGAADDHVHLDLRYLLLGPDARPTPPAGESQEVDWFTWEEAHALADGSLVGALRAAHRLIAAGVVEVPGMTAEEDDG